MYELSEPDSFFKASEADTVGRRSMMSQFEGSRKIEIGIIRDEEDVKFEMSLSSIVTVFDGLVVVGAV